MYAEDCCDPCLLELQNHLPKYYGTWSSPDSPNGKRLDFVCIHLSLTKFKNTCWSAKLAVLINIWSAQEIKILLTLQYGQVQYPKLQKQMQLFDKGKLCDKQHHNEVQQCRKDCPDQVCLVQTKTNVISSSL